MTAPAGQRLALAALPEAHHRPRPGASGGAPRATRASSSAVGPSSIRAWEAGRSVLGLIRDAAHAGRVAHGRDGERPLVPAVEDVLAGEAAVDERAGLELPEHAVPGVGGARAAAPAPSARASRSARGSSACAGRCAAPRSPARPRPSPPRCTPTAGAPGRPPSPRPGGRSASSRAARSAPTASGTKRRPAHLDLGHEHQLARLGIHAHRPASGQVHQAGALGQGDGRPREGASPRLPTGRSPGAAGARGPFRSGRRSAARGSGTAAWRTAT